MSRLFQALCLIVVLAAPGWAQDDVAKPETRQQRSALDRWNSLAPEQQERMRGRYKRWQRLSSEERNEYQRRAEEMGRARNEALRHLRPEDHARFEELDKETREGVLHELTHLMLIERTHRLRGKLPSEAQARLEGASPEERKAILDEFRHGGLRKAGERALEDLAHKLELSTEQIEAIRVLPPKERREELLTLKRRAIEGGILDGTRPKDVDERDWEKMRDLPPRDFARDLFRHKDHADMSRRDRRHRQIQEMLVPTLDELIEVSRAPEPERHALMESLVRTRVQAQAGDKDNLPRGLLEEMQGANDHEFIRRLRHFTRPPRDAQANPHHPGEDGHPRPRDQRPGRVGQPHRPGPPGGADRPGTTDRSRARRDHDGKPGRETDTPRRQRL